MKKKVKQRAEAVFFPEWIVLSMHVNPEQVKIAPLTVMIIYAVGRYRYYVVMYGTQYFPIDYFEYFFFHFRVPGIVVF